MAKYYRQELQIYLKKNRENYLFQLKEQEI
jgi:hypothetical protein